MYFFIAVIMLTVGYSNFQTFRPYHIQDIDSQNAMPILNKDHIIKPGEIIRWQVHTVTYMGGISDDYTYYLEPAEGQDVCDFRILQQGRGATKEGIVNHVSAMTRVPMDFRPCTYHVRILVVFHVSPSRDIVTNAQTEDFEVK